MEKRTRHTANDDDLSKWYALDRHVRGGSDAPPMLIFNCRQCGDSTSLDAIDFKEIGLPDFCEKCGHGRS